MNKSNFKIGIPKSFKPKSNAQDLSEVISALLDPKDILAKITNMERARLRDISEGSQQRAQRYNLTQMQEIKRSATSQLVYKMKTIIHPDSIVKKIWNIVLIFLLVYTAILMPYRLAFIQGTIYDT